jgi:hypothetical protein
MMPFAIVVGDSLHCAGISTRRPSPFSLLRQRKGTKRSRRGGALTWQSQVMRTPKATPVPRPRKYRGCLALLAGGGKRRTRPGTGSNICASFSASRCAAQLVSGGPKAQYTTARCASPWLKEWTSPRRLAQPNEPPAGVRSWGSRGRRRAAQGKTEKEVQMFEPAGRVSELPGLTEQRRAVPVLRDRRIRGRLWCAHNLALPSERTPSSRPFGDFSLAKQRKVTALSGAHPDAVHRNRHQRSNAEKTQSADKGVAP